MNEQPLSTQLLGQIDKLAQKFQIMGQDMSSYLDGLLYANYLTYWDYIHLDTLLSLQNPKTPFKDEVIFITYHQITELYFKLVLHEIKQITEKDELKIEEFNDRLKRINRYFKQLVSSFDVMVSGMSVEEFLKFRMALLPASGFQSAQFRKIEICSTDIWNLVSKSHRHLISEDSTVEEMFDHIYWKQGATELASGAKTLTLRQFEAHYSESLLNLALEYRNKNIGRVFKEMANHENLRQTMREFDALVNIDWALAHYSSAMRYLQREPEVISATGGTNWQEYLPPKFQKVMFFPELWTEEEQKDWGKAWVIAQLGRK